MNIRGGTTLQDEHNFVNIYVNGTNIERWKNGCFSLKVLCHQWQFSLILGAKLAGRVV